MRLYRIDLEYVKYMHEKGDKRVQYNEAQSEEYNLNRPYVGIVMKINNIDFFAPLEHPRPNHQRLKNNPHIIKINNGKLGIVALGNMIPVPENKLIDIDIKTEADQKYANLLMKQAIFCRKHKNEIQHKAEITYQNVTVKKLPFYTSVCCDFEKLIEAYYKTVK